MPAVNSKFAKKDGAASREGIDECASARPVSPDDFFDELETIFGNTDGYAVHLKQIKELKKRKDELEAWVKPNAYHCRAILKENEELKEKNKKLELAVLEANARAEDLVGNWAGLAEDVVEVARLEDELNYLRERDDRADEIQKELDYQKLNLRKAMDENETVHKCWSDAQAENKGLKEDVQQYKDTLEDHFHHYELLKAKKDNLEAENKKLIEEIELLNCQLFNLRIYLVDVGGDCAEVFDNILKEAEEQ